MTDAIRTYEIVTREGRIRMDIPDDWKVTYGPLSPVSGKGYGGNSTLALRVYENETKQRAIFVDVSAFRDLSIPVQRLLVKRTGSETWESDSTGSSSRNQKAVVERRWVSDEEFDGIEKEELPF